MNTKLTYQLIRIEKRILYTSLETFFVQAPKWLATFKCDPKWMRTLSSAVTRASKFLVLFVCKRTILTETVRAFVSVPSFIRARASALIVWWNPPFLNWIQLNFKIPFITEMLNSVSEWNAAIYWFNLPKRSRLLGNSQILL